MLTHDLAPEKRESLQRTLLGQLTKFKYGPWVIEQYYFSVQFPDLDNCTYGFKL